MAAECERPRLGGFDTGVRRGDAVPDLPRRMAVAVDFLELLAVLERIHRHPEPVVLVCSQSLDRDQPLERFTNELLAVPEVLEDLAAQHEEPAVDANRRLLNVLDGGDDSVRVAR